MMCLLQIQQALQAMAWQQVGQRDRQMDLSGLVQVQVQEQVQVQVQVLVQALVQLLALAPRHAPVLTPFFSPSLLGVAHTVCTTGALRTSTGQSA
jgi:hypothetical protein